MLHFLGGESKRSATVKSTFKVLPSLLTKIPTEFQENNLYELNFGLIEAI